MLIAFNQTTISAKLHIDWFLLVSILLLSCYGIVLLYSASDRNSDIIIDHSIKLVLGLVCMFSLAQFSPTTIERYSIVVYIVSIILLLLVLTVGEVGKGAQRWLNLGVFYFQPSELVKLTLPMMIAAYIANNPFPPDLKRIAICGLFISIPVFLILKQPDLGTALIIVATGLAVLFVAGLAYKIIVLMAIMLASLMPFFWYMLHDYQRERIFTYISPERDPLGAGYHIIQSNIAIGSGGMYGKGLFQSTQSRLEFLPESTTDFVFSLLCEEFGLIGVIVLFILYLSIIGRVLYIAMNTKHTYSALIATTIAISFFIGIFVNTAMASGQLPVVGVPLPLISYGGSSMVILMISFGVIMSIHTHKNLLLH